MREEPEPTRLFVLQLNSPSNKVGSKEPLMVARSPILLPDGRECHGGVAVQMDVELVTTAGAQNIKLLELLLGQRG